MKVETLMSREREEFARIVNILFTDNCVYQYSKIHNFEKKERCLEYSFITEHWDCFSEYLQFAGWSLRKDRSSYMGMIYIHNDREDCVSSYRLTMPETQLLVILRNFYEEKMIELDASLTVKIAVNEVIRLLVDVFAMVTTKPNATTIANALYTLQRLNVIQRFRVGDEEFLWVLPYITCVLSPEKIEEILQIIQQGEGGEDDEAEEDVTDQLAVL